MHEGFCYFELNHKDNRTSEQAILINNPDFVGTWYGCTGVHVKVKVTYIRIQELGKSCFHGALSAYIHMRSDFGRSK